MDSKELFENNCMPMFWMEDEEHFENNVQNVPVARKDLDTLLGELDEIQDRIDELSAKEWHLEKLVQLRKAGFTH